MPEGVGSIAEMQVVVDTNEEKFGKSMMAMRSVVQNFSGDGSRSLALFDASVLKMGASIDAIKARLGIWLQVAELAMGMVLNFDSYASSLAERVGKKEEYEKVKGAVVDLYNAVGEGLAGAYTRAKQEIYAATGAMDQAKDKQLDLQFATNFTRDGVKANLAEMVVEAERLRDFLSDPSQWTLEALMRGVERAAQSFRRLTDPENWSYETVRKEIKTTEERIDALVKKTNESMDGNSSWLSRLLGADDVGALQARLKELTDNIDALRGRAKELYEQLVDDAAAKFEQQLKAEIDALDRQITTFGMAKDEIAAYNAVRKITEELLKNGKVLSEAEAEALADVADKIRAATRRYEEMNRAKAGADALDTMRDRTRELDVRNRTIDLSKAEQQEARQLSDLDAKIRSGRLAMSDEQYQAARREIAAQRDLNQAYDDANAHKGEADKVDRLLVSGEREVQQLQQRARAYGMTTREAARLNMEEKLLLQARQQHLNLGPAEETMIKQIAESYGRAQQALEDMQRAMQFVRESGQIAARGLETAFKNWMEGTKTDTKELVRSMIADFAMLTFRRGVTEPLVNMFTQGVGSIMSQQSGGLAGLFGGFRAEGGDVDAGRVYMVGERGPEPFVPKVPGRIIPSGAALGGGTSVSVTFAPRIDASGAYPESIAELKRHLTAMQADMPGKVLEVVRDSRERGLA